MEFGNASLRDVNCGGARGWQIMFLTVFLPFYEAHQDEDDVYLPTVSCLFLVLRVSQHAVNSLLGLLLAPRTRRLLGCSRSPEQKACI